MPKKVPLMTVGVHRDGATIYPEIGKPFDFTDAEVKELTKMAKDNKVDYLRSTVNEDKGESKADANKEPAL